MTSDNTLVRNTDIRSGVTLEMVCNELVNITLEDL